MLRATLRALFAYKVRLALSALSIVLGVAFVAGTFIFTDSLKQAFSDLTKAGQSDLVVRPQQAFQTRMSADTTVRTLPQSLVDTISALPGTAEAAGVVQVRNVTVLGPDGKPVMAQMGPGSVGTGDSWTTAPSLQLWKLASGAAPAAPDQVVLDQTSAEKAGLQVGQQVEVLLPNGTIQKPTISGLAEGTLSALGSGGSTVLWDLATAESLLTKPGEVTSIRVTAKPGVSQADLQQQVMAILPPDVSSQTGEQTSSDLSRSLNERLGFLNTFLLVFGLIALFVSAFLIYNTFSILVAQRTRELALMRAIGATRRQVRTSVLVEALVVAIVAATVGLLVGIGVSQGLRGLFAALGAPLPGTGLVLLPRTFAVAYGIGLVVTLISALIPAQRAASIAPVAAMRSDATPAAKSLRRRGIVGTILLLVAIGMGAWALSIPGGGTKAAQILGASALAAIFAALALAPLAARLLVPIIGLPFRRSAVGRLAIENARRNPRRTAATASRPRGRGGMTTLTRTPTAAPTRVSRIRLSATCSDPLTARMSIAETATSSSPSWRLRTFPTSSEDATTAASDHALNPTTIENPTAISTPVTTAATRRAPTARVAVRVAWTTSRAVRAPVTGRAAWSRFWHAT